MFTKYIVENYLNKKSISLRTFSREVHVATSVLYGYDEGRLPNFRIIINISDYLSEISKKSKKKIFLELSTLIYEINLNNQEKIN